MFLVIWIEWNLKDTEKLFEQINVVYMLRARCVSYLVIKQFMITIEIDFLKIEIFFVFMQSVFQCQVHKSFMNI